MTGITPAQVGLSNVTNESKATMFSNPTFTGTVNGITAGMVGLGNCDNTSDVNKPVSTAQATAIGSKADKSATVLLNTLTVNTNAFLVNANKRVLIGATDDGVSLLQVAGSIKVSSGSVGSSDITAATTAGAGVGYSRLILKTSDREWRLVNDAGTSGSPLMIYDATANAERLRVTSNGNILIGTTANDGVNLLQVAGSGIVHGKLDVHPSVGGGALVVGGWDAIGQTGTTLTLGGITASQWDTLALYTSGYERARVTPAGNLLLGTTYDDGVNMMRIAGGISSNSWIVSKDKPNNPASTGVNLNSISIGKDGTTGMGWIQSYGSSGVQATQINPMGGNVLIGTATDSNSAYKLQVNGNMYSTGNLCLYPGTGNRTKIYIDDPGYLTWIIGAGTTTPGYLSITRTIGGSDGILISNMGHTLIGSATDDGVNQLQVNGSISSTTYIETPRIRVIKDGSSTQTDALQVKNAAGTQYIGWQLGPNGEADLYNTVNSGGSWTKLLSASSTGFLISSPLIIGTTTNDGLHKLQVNGSISSINGYAIQSLSTRPANNYDWVLEYNSNTSVKLWMKGSDGVNRSVTLTLA